MSLLFNVADGSRDEKPRITLKRKIITDSSSSAASSSVSSSSSKRVKCVGDDEDDANHSGKENRKPQSGKGVGGLQLEKDETCIICLCEMNFPVAKVSNFQIIDLLNILA